MTRRTPFRGAPALRPEHVCLVGVRSFEPEEMALAIMAEIVAVRYARDGVSLSLKEGGSRAATA